MVLDPRKKEMVKISLDWLVDNFGVSGLEKSIHGFLRDNCPNLLAKGLVKYEDFSVKSSGASGALRRQEKMMGNSSSSSASFDGVQYYIGRNQFDFEGKSYPNNKLKVVLLDKNTGGIVAVDNGKEKIICVFDFISQEEKAVKHRQLEEYVGHKMTLSQLTPRTNLKKEEMQKRLRPWLVSGENPKRKDETSEQYAERLSSVSDYNYLNRITGDFLKETGLGIHNLNWREQQWLAAATFELNTQGKKSELLGFTKKFGLSGLKSFLTCEFDIENGKKIIEIGSKIKTEDASLIFSKLSELVNLAQEKDHELAQLVYKSGKGEVPTDMRTELLRKAHQIILKFSTELESVAQESEEKIQKLLADLEKSRIDIEIMAALLVATKKAGAEQNVSGIKGVEIETAGEKELMENPALVEKLTEMYRASIEHKSKEDQARLLGDFETHKQYDPRFHLVYFDRASAKALAGKQKNHPDNLVGFMRSSSFDGQKELPEGERYLGAMNIDPILQKFYFGENFLREIVEKEFSSGTKKLIAHVPENGPSHKIVKLLGFETVAEEGDYRDDAGNITAKRLRVELVKK